MKREGGRNGGVLALGTATKRGEDCDGADLATSNQQQQQQIADTATSCGRYLGSGVAVEADKWVRASRSLHATKDSLAIACAISAWNACCRLRELISITRRRLSLSSTYRAHHTCRRHQKYC